MKDFTGHTVCVGDYIFYSTPGRFPESRIGRVTRFTPKGSMFAAILKRNRQNFSSDQEEVIVKNDFVILKDYPREYTY